MTSIVYMFEADAATGSAIAIREFPSQAHASTFVLPAGSVMVMFDPQLGDIKDFRTDLVDGEIAVVDRVPDIEADLVVAKLLKWADVKALRAERVTAGVDVPGIGRFDSSPEAIAAVNGAQAAAVGMIALGTPELFNVTWDLADNSSMSLTAEQMITVQATGVAYVNAIQTRSRELRNLIIAATTMGELLAIDTTTGWP